MTLECSTPPEEGHMRPIPHLAPSSDGPTISQIPRQASLLYRGRGVDRRIRQQLRRQLVRRMKQRGRDGHREQRSCSSCNPFSRPRESKLSFQARRVEQKRTGHVALATNNRGRPAEALDRPSTCSHWSRQAGARAAPPVLLGRNNQGLLSAGER